MKEQLLKDIKAGFDSLNEKLSEMLSLLTDEPKKQPITIKTKLTREEAGYKMALLIRDFYIYEQPHKIIGIRLDGFPIFIWPGNYDGVVIAEFYDTQESGLLKGYRVDALQNWNFWTNELIEEISNAILDNYDNSLINVEYEE
ncbi:MAG: hypothetical protein KAR42_15245 [candidate division Zixibacteria bacterium]|nr:hypothetical protein [candidate division Zixibacteria bacterium]